MENQHYYSSEPTSASHPQTVWVKARGVEVKVTTDSGVFAKKGLDYGSRLLIETVDLSGVEQAIDLGCGYGVVSAVLANVYPSVSWLMIDVNERAVELAAKNTSFAKSRVHIVQSDGFRQVPDARADAVLLNPPIRAGKAVVYRLFEESAAHLNENGALWVVIHKKHGAESAKAELGRRFEEVELADRDAGYHIFKCLRTRR